jgi:alcohol dehydrogenase
MTTVRAAVLESPERFEIRSYPRPQVGPEEALIEVELAGICGTDWKTFHGKLPYRMPIILGHEILGRIAEIGERARERYRLAQGDRVVVEGTVPCWACRMCQTGNYRLCRQRRGYGTSTPATTPPHLWGAFADHMYIAPGTVLHRISDAVPARAAVLAQGVLGNGIQWARNKGGVRYQDVVVIQGAGPQGLACAVVSRECGAGRVIMTGLARDAERLALAREFGVDVTIDVERDDPYETVRSLTGGALADVVIDVTGSPSAIAASVKMVRPQGTLVLAGLTGDRVLTPVEIDLLVWNEVTVKGVYTKGADAIEDSIKLIESRKYPLERMVTHIYGLDRAAEAIRAIGGELAGTYPVKAAVSPGEVQA